MKLNELQPAYGSTTKKKRVGRGGKYSKTAGKGEKGQCSIIVNSDGSGNAGESSAIDIEFKKQGKTPTEYTYAVA